jgi:hypothetical protein
MWHFKPRNPYTDLNFSPSYFSGFKIEAEHVVLGAGETFAALIHHLTTADKKRCSWDGKLTFRDFFVLKCNVYYEKGGKFCCYSYYIRNFVYRISTKFCSGEKC